MTTDPAAAFAGGTWNRDALDDHGGSLPNGQGVDTLFYGGQLATIQYGRWILPNLKKLKNLQYDIAPMPSEDGKTISLAAVYTAAMSVRTGAKDKNAALMFLGRFVNADGQKARLSGGGNAVPSMEGLETSSSRVGSRRTRSTSRRRRRRANAVPEVIAPSAKVSTNFQTQMDTIIKGGASAQEFATKMAAFINAGG